MQWNKEQNEDQTVLNKEGKATGLEPFSTKNTKKTEQDRPFMTKNTKNRTEQNGK